MFAFENVTVKKTFLKIVIMLKHHYVSVKIIENVDYRGYNIITNWN